MPQEITTINLGGVNCYLAKTGDGFVLIDTGVATKRAALEQELTRAGCQPGNLKLIILTHGDSDHADNCAYLRDKYGAKIAMHKSDAGMVEHGDMKWGRKPKPDKFALLFRIMSSFVKPGKFDMFKPDLTITEGFDLSQYGFDAQVLHIPGHSKGSLGILTTDGDPSTGSGQVLYCGDLVYNFVRPSAAFIDDLADWNASIEKLKRFKINMVYPGHGKAFPMDAFLKRM
jgi:hydroxyacylglutathione hydrolase